MQNYTICSLINNILVFIPGFALGGFYNMLIYSLPRNLPVFKGGLSFSAAFAGKRHMAVALLTGAMLVMALRVFGGGWAFFMHASLWSMLLITAVIDFEHMVISTWVLLGFSPGAILYVVFTGAPAISHLLGLIMGFGFYFLIYFVVKILYKREAFGYGDVLLMGAAGLFLGLPKALLTCMLSFYVALFAIILMKIAGKKITAKQEVPFGPYICIAAFIASLFGDKILRLFAWIY